MVRQFFLAVALSICGLTASAQTTEISAPLTGNWNNVVTGTHPGADNCCSGGPQPLYDPATDTIHFSYQLTAVHRVIAINQALSGSGVQINGYNWGYDLRNMNGVRGVQNGTDSMVVSTFMTNRFNQFLVQDDRHYNTQFDWTRFSGTVGLPSSLSLADAGSLGIQFVSRDDGYWSGYYGPQVRNVEMTVNYTAAPVDPCVSDPQSSPGCPGYKNFITDTVNNQGWAQVDIPFSFPFYGQNFTTSYMFRDGYVGFLNPNWISPQSSNLHDQRFVQNSPWNFSIFALATEYDLGTNSQLFTENIDNGQGIRYTWNRVLQADTTRENTFNVELRSSGSIRLGYSRIDLSPDTTVLMGSIAGNAYDLQYRQFFHGAGSVYSGASGTLSYTGNETTNICASNPLVDSRCPGYAEALFQQQCSVNALYDPACPGYATAYYNYQCSVDALYHTGCAGYATAYFDQQCGMDALYDQKCTGYADAYYVQQCTVSALYDSGCDGYVTAVFDQQCANDALYDNTCPGYAEAYAKKFILVAAPAAESSAAEPETAAVTQATVTETKEAVVTAITTETAVAVTVSASPAVAATAPVSLAAAPAPATAAPAEKKAEAKTETKTEAAVASSSAGESKSRPKTTRQALAQRRLEAAREAAAESAKDNPGAATSQMDSAASMEQQVELQGVVMGAMGFVAGFDAYGRVTLQDAAGYKPFEIYQGQTNVDTPAARGLLGRSDRLHQEMIDQQYGESK